VTVAVSGPDDITTPKMFRTDPEDVGVGMADRAAHRYALGSEPA
jgi:hypothetical protein